MSGDREIDLRIEICVFFGDEFFFGDFNVAIPQRRSSTHTLTLTNTHTLTHTHDWPTVAYRSSGSRGDFSGFFMIAGVHLLRDFKPWRT